MGREVNDGSSVEAMEAKVLTRVKTISLKYKYTDEENLSGIVENTAKVVTDLVEPKEPTPEDPSEEKTVKTDEPEEVTHEIPVEIQTKVIECIKSNKGDDTHRKKHSCCR